MALKDLHTGSTQKEKKIKLMKKYLIHLLFTHPQHLAALPCFFHAFLNASHQQEHC
jgi:hypothetical protein